nr:cation acetate symporter [Endozoicomonas sp.]
RMNREGAIAGMVTGLVFTASYIIYFKFLGGTSAGWWFGVSPEGIGTLGMLINFTVSMVVCHVTEAPPQSVQDMVEDIRIPRRGGTASKPAEEGETARA